MFHVAKPYALNAENQKRRHWAQTVAQPLNGKTLGILGLGAVGQEVARIAACLGMRAIGTRRRPEPMPHVDAVLPAGRTDEVLAQSVFVLLLVPATRPTDGLLHPGRLAAKNHPPRGRQDDGSGKSGSHWVQTVVCTA